MPAGYGGASCAAASRSRTRTLSPQRAASAAFTCTDSKGGFKLEVPAGQDITLSVVLKDGSEALRDRDGITLKPGQVVFREIDLAGVAPPCKEPPGDPTPPKISRRPQNLPGTSRRYHRRTTASRW